MRHLLLTALSFAVSVAVVTAGATVPTVAQASAEEPDAEALYQEGKAAFDSEDFATAADRWERSYRASGDPLVLYNIGEAYMGMYGESDDPAHLEKAQVALQELSGFVEEDPTLGDPDELAAMLKEIDDKLGGGEEPEDPVEEPVEDPVEDPEPEKPEKDKATTLRNAGIGTMAAGGVLVLGGVIAGSVFAAKGSGLTADLNELYMMNATESELQTVRDQGKAANTASGVSFGLGIALGGAAIAVGAVLLSKSKKLRAEGGDEEARIRVAPTLGGFVLSGRF